MPLFVHKPVMHPGLQVKDSKHSIKQGKTGQARRTQQDMTRTIQDKARQGQTRRMTRPNETRRDEMRQGKAKQAKVRQGKTRQDEKGQGKTRRDAARQGEAR